METYLSEAITDKIFIMEASTGGSNIYYLLVNKKPYIDDEGEPIYFRNLLEAKEYVKDNFKELQEITNV